MPDTTDTAAAAAKAIADTVTPAAAESYPGESESQGLIRELLQRLERLENHIHGEGGERIIRE